MNSSTCQQNGGLYFGDQTDCRSVTAGASPPSWDTQILSTIRLETFESAASWSGSLSQLIIGVDPSQPDNRVVLLNEQGDASFFKEVAWPTGAMQLSFDYMFQEPRAAENLTVYVGDEIAYYDNAETTLAKGTLTASGPIYIGNVADTTKRLNFVLRSDQAQGGELGGGVLIDNIRVHGFVNADGDLDGDRDLADFARFFRCFRADSLPAECWTFDVDEDATLDLSDFGGDPEEPATYTGLAALLEGPMPIEGL